MAADVRALPAREVEALLSRYLDGAPGVVRTPLKGGLGFRCRGVFDDDGAAWLFAVAAEGGVLLRLPAALQERVVDKGLGAPNAALPDWVLHLEPPSIGRRPPTAREPANPEVVGRPEEWVWMPVRDGQSFERRRPHILEALEYCRHRMTVTRT